MLSLVKAFSRTSRIHLNVSRCGYVCRQGRQYSKNESNDIIKVTVIGSGSFGDPASLLITTCDNVM